MKSGLRESCTKKVPSQSKHAQQRTSKSGKAGARSRKICEVDGKRPRWRRRRRHMGHVMTWYSMWARPLTAVPSGVDSNSIETTTTSWIFQTMHLLWISIKRQYRCGLDCASAPNVIICGSLVAPMGLWYGTPDHQLKSIFAEAHGERGWLAHPSTLRWGGNRWRQHP